MDLLSLGVLNVFSLRSLKIQSPHNIKLIVGLPITTFSGIRMLGLRTSLCSSGTSLSLSKQIQRTGSGLTSSQKWYEGSHVEFL